MPLTCDTPQLISPAPSWLPAGKLIVIVASSLLLTSDLEVDREGREPTELVVPGADGPLMVFPGERKLADSELSLDAEIPAGAAGLMTGVAMDALDGLVVERELPGLEARLQRLELPLPTRRDAVPTSGCPRPPRRRSTPRRRSQDRRRMRPPTPSLLLAECSPTCSLRSIADGPTGTRTPGWLSARALPRAQRTHDIRRFKAHAVRDGRVSNLGDVRRSGGRPSC